MARKAKGRKAKAASIEVGSIPKLKLDMPLDDRKIAAIKRCLAKGKLTITVSKVDLATGRLGDPYLYD
jgi:hypothetical protein